MILGVLQGRLSKPVNGHYQEFPPTWGEEISLLPDLGLSGVEWLITNNVFRDNPLFNNTQNGYIMSVCLDNLVSDQICDEIFLAQNLDPICNLLSSTFINILTIPILDDSDLNDDGKRKQFCQLIQNYGPRYPNLKFAFESEMPIHKLDEIVSLCDNFYVTYDTGNITSCGVNHEEYITFFKDKIINVHIKDRTYERQTVEPMSGDTDFHLIFRKLSEINYKGQFILQTAIGQTGQEIDTIKKHTKIFKGLYAKYF